MTPLVDLRGKRGLIVGIANEQSIAAGCAEAFSRCGARLAATYLNEKAKGWVEPVADRLGATAPPDGWADLIALLDKARAAGVQPLAIGREAWEHTLLFESVAVGVGGAEFYRKAFIDLNPQALQTPVLTQIFERMRQLAGYLDPGFLQRRWDQATDMVAGGQALLQVQVPEQERQPGAPGRRPAQGSGPHRLPQQPEGCRDPRWKRPGFAQRAQRKVPPQVPAVPVRGWQH